VGHSELAHLQQRLLLLLLLLLLLCWIACAWCHHWVLLLGCHRCVPHPLLLPPLACLQLCALLLQVLLLLVSPQVLLLVVPLLPLSLLACAWLLLCPAGT
jgi:hypothetical protein